MLTAALVSSTCALAQISFSIVVAPPAPLYEAAPYLPPGYVWAPGYWAWNYDRHIWVRGRTMLQRAGYRWQPDHWEQRDGAYSRQVGRWEPDRMDRPEHRNYAGDAQGNHNQPPKHKKVRKDKNNREH